MKMIFSEFLDYIELAKRYAQIPKIWYLGFKSQNHTEKVNIKTKTKTVNTMPKKRNIPSLIRKKNNLICSGLNNHFNPLKIALKLQAIDILKALAKFSATIVIKLGFLFLILSYLIM